MPINTNLLNLKVINKHFVFNFVFIKKWMKKDKDLKNDSISALAGVGLLRIHSDDVYDILKKLKFKQ